MNAGELNWIPRATPGALLVVNDGFTSDYHAIYEIAVEPDGSAGEPRALLEYGIEFPRAGAVALLPDGRYGVATIQFPPLEGDDLTLELVAIEREAPEGTTPEVETLFTATTQFLGGAEPSYIGISVTETAIDIGWTQPSEGGRAELIHLVWQGAELVESRFTQLLPPEIPPLSGDAAVWPLSDGKVMLRSGFERFAVAVADPVASTFSPLVLLDDVPLYAWNDLLLSLRYEDDFIEELAGYPVSYLVTTLDGTEVSRSEGWALQEYTWPHAATPYQGGALVAPLSSHGSFPSIEVGWASPTEALRSVGSIPRQGTSDVYAGRAYAADGKVYVAWTEVPEGVHDLWVGVTDIDLQLTGVAP
jgi:hypothetical protein